MRGTVSVVPPPPQISRKRATVIKIAACAAAVGLSMGVAAAAAVAMRDLPTRVASYGVMAIRLSDAPPLSAASANTPRVRADEKLVRKGRSPLGAGFLTIPPSFTSEDGAYDLVIHVHGNADLVEESFAVAKINAVVVILNYGINSGVYENRFNNAVMLPDIEGRARATMQKRGLRSPHLRRLAMTAWSAGYGAILRTLEQPALADTVDAVVLLDGIHVGYAHKGSTELALERLAPFTRFAKRAVQGDRLFSITHSEIQPGDYAGTKETTDALLQQLGLSRKPGGVTPEWPTMVSARRAVAKDKARPLVPKSQVHEGDFHVRGYTGTTPEDHASHLIQMAYTALPDLREWWSRSQRDHEP